MDLFATGSLILAATFLISGSSKVFGRRTTELAAQHFGLGPAGARVVSLALPVAEIFLGVALMTPILIRPASLLAVLTLLVFTDLVVRSIHSDNPVACNCFGKLSNHPMNGTTDRRNAPQVKSSPKMHRLILAGPQAAGQFSKRRRPALYERRSSHARKTFRYRWASSAITMTDSGPIQVSIINVATPSGSRNHLVPTAWLRFACTRALRRAEARTLKPPANSEDAY